MSNKRDRFHYIGNTAVIFAGGGAGLGMLFDSATVGLIGIPIGLVVGIFVGIHEERRKEREEQAEDKS